MALFDKCREFNRKVEFLKLRDQFFYLREVYPAANPVVAMKDRHVIMLGSKNYLGLTSHPKVIEETLKAIRKYGTGVIGLTGHGTLEHSRAD